jgi:hypothetical protein
MDYDSYGTSASPEEKEPPEEIEESEDTENTALVPKSFFGHDCKVGDKYTVVVKHLYDDEIEIAHVREKKE